MRRISTGLSTEVPHAYHAVHLEDRFISAIQSLAKLATTDCFPSTVFYFRHSSRQWTGLLFQSLLLVRGDLRLRQPPMLPRRLLDITWVLRGSHAARKEFTHILISRDNALGIETYAIYS